MPWIYNEDAALKAKLQGLYVQDGNAPQPMGRSVPVRFKLPEDELANLSYPIIIIEHLGFYPDPEREHRSAQGYQIPYAPEGFPQWNYGEGPFGPTLDPSQSPYTGFFPIPFNFDYKVTVYGRFMTQHIRPLTAQLLTEHYLPYHYGYLQVPQDGTVRSMFLLGGPDFTYAKDEDDKRLLAVVFRVRVFTELVQGVQSLESFGGTMVPVNTVDLDLSVYASIDDIALGTPAEIEANRGLLSVGVASSFNTDTPLP